MGLAERKVKREWTARMHWELTAERIGLDPRNLTWSNDTNRFSFKHMTALGWDESKGIGKSGDGMATHIAVARKTDNTGIGMGRIMRETGEMSAGAGQAGAGLEDVLRRLASRAGSSASASPAPSAAPSPAPASPAPSSAPASIRNKMA
jgi:Pin2-interacting protein X1